MSTTFSQTAGKGIEDVESAYVPILFRANIEFEELWLQVHREKRLISKDKMNLGVGTLVWIGDDPLNFGTTFKVSAIFQKQSYEWICSREDFLHASQQFDSIDIPLTHSS